MGEVDVPPHADDPGAAGGIFRNAGFALAVRLMSAAFTAGLTLFLVRRLGPRDYGIFTLALSAGGLALLPSDFGISQAAARYVAEVRGDADAVAKVVADALRLKLVASGAVAVLLVALAGPIASAYQTPALAGPIRILSIGLFGQSLLFLYDGVFEATGRISQYLRVVTVESALEAGLSIGLVLLGGGASGAMAGRAGAYAFGAGFGLVLLGRSLHRRILPGRSSGGGHTRRLATYGSALLIVDGAFTLFSRIDILLIGAILTVPAVARFSAPLMLVGFLGYLGQAVSAGVAPRLASAEGEPDGAAFERALHYLIAFQGMLLAPLIVWAKPITDLLLGPGYGQSAGVLRGLSAFAFLVGISPLLAHAVNYLGEARRRIPIAIAAVLLNAAIDVVLLPEIGVVAGAVGTGIAYAFYASANLLLCRRLLGIALRPLGWTLARVLVAAAGMAGVLALFGTDQVGVPLLVAGTLLGAAGYVGFLLALRVVGPDDLSAVGRRVRGILPGAA